MKLFQGSCHCDPVQFAIHNQTELPNLMRGDCSLCRRQGAIMATALLDDLVITKGEDKLYQSECFG